MAKKLSKSQNAVMVWVSRGWKAYVAYGNRVEVNGRPVCTTATMETLEKLGLVVREGVAAWSATEAGKALQDAAPSKVE